MSEQNIIADHTGLVALFIANLAGIVVLIFNSGKYAARIAVAEQDIVYLKGKFNQFQELDKQVGILTEKIENLCEKVDLLMEKRYDR